MLVIVLCSYLPGHLLGRLLRSRIKRRGGCIFYAPIRLGIEDDMMRDLLVVVDWILRLTGGGDTEPSLVALRFSELGLSDIIDSNLAAGFKRLRATAGNR